MYIQTCVILGAHWVFLPVPIFQVPLLNYLTECEAYNNKLVRFKGMIQDIMNPVYYIEQFHVVNTKTNVTSVKSGKYRDRMELGVCNSYLLG